MPQQQWPNPTPRPVLINNGGRRPDYGPLPGDNGVIDWPTRKGSSNRKPDRGHGFQGLGGGFDSQNEYPHGGGLGLDATPGSTSHGPNRMLLGGPDNGYDGRPGWGIGPGWGHDPRFRNEPGGKNGGSRSGKDPAAYTGGSIRCGPGSQLSMWALAVMVCVLDISGVI